MWQSIRHKREPFESEINEEIEEQYQQLQAEKDSDDDGMEELDTRMQELEARMDASNERLEAKIDASNTRLESKIDESHQRLEAMFRQLIAGKASHTDSTLPQSTDLPVPAAPVELHVTPTPTSITDKTRPPSPNHGASGVSNRSGAEDANMGAAEEHGGGTSMDKAEGGGSEEGDAGVGTTAVPKVVEEVHDDVETPASAAQSSEPVHTDQVN